MCPREPGGPGTAPRCPPTRCCRSSARHRRRCPGAAPSVRPRSRPSRSTQRTGGVRRGPARSVRAARPRRASRRAGGGRPRRRPARGRRGWKPRALGVDPHEGDLVAPDGGQELRGTRGARRGQASLGPVGEAVDEQVAAAPGRVGRQGAGGHGRAWLAPAARVGRDRGAVPAGAEIDVEGDRPGTHRERLGVSVAPRVGHQAVGTVPGALAPHAQAVEGGDLGRRSRRGQRGGGRRDRREESAARGISTAESAVHRRGMRSERLRHPSRPRWRCTASCLARGGSSAERRHR